MSDQDRARAIGAVFGAAIGVLLALAAVALIFPTDHATLHASDAGVLDWMVKAAGKPSFIEDREKGFYALSLLLGTFGAFIGASRWIAGARASIAALTGLALLAPALNEITRQAIAAPGWLAALWALGAAAALAALCALLMHRSPRPMESAAVRVASAQDWSLRQEWRPALAALAVIVLLIYPLDAKGMAASIGLEMHLASYMAGPALYAFAKESLIPGIDYFTQYSIGTPWLFHFLLGPTAAGAVENAVWFQVAEIFFFEATFLYFLRTFLRSWSWALVIAVAALLVQFTTPDPLYAPSSLASRYVLAPLVAILLTRWVRKDFALAFMPAVSAALAGALFLNTETGVYAALAAALATMAAAPALLLGVRRVAVLAAAAFSAFMVLSVLAFGPGVLDYRFLLYLFEPFFIYGGGMGAWAVDWARGLHWIYNIVSPGLALASIGWAIAQRRRAPALDASETAALVFVSAFGLFLTAKFINMSIVALWQVNSWALLVVAAWWAHRLLAKAPAIPLGGGRRISGEAAAAAGAAVVLFAFLASINDPRNPSLYAVAAYRTFPSIVNKLTGGTSSACTPGRVGCAIKTVDPTDVALIQ
ncbi:MAG: hypothetical protein AB7M12_14540, partial [Hyphomonadaceae bacterium]